MMFQCLTQFAASFPSLGAEVYTDKNNEKIQKESFI